MSELPQKQRDLPLTQREKDALAECFGLIKSVAWKHRGWGIPDLESELMLQAVRIMPGWDGKRALGPFLQASLSRYCINLLRDRKDRERCETDESGGAEDSVLDKAFASDPEPVDALIDQEETIENWGNGSSNSPRVSVKKWENLDPDKPSQEPPKRASGRAARWIRKNAHLLGQWRGWAFLEAQSGLCREELQKAMQRDGYSLGKATKRKSRATTQGGGLFHQEAPAVLTDTDIKRFLEVTASYHRRGQTSKAMFRTGSREKWLQFQDAAFSGFDQALRDLEALRAEIRNAAQAGHLAKESPLASLVA